MKFGDFMRVFIIIVIFMLLYLSSIISVGLKTLKSNWPQYKCNPVAMPFAGYLGYDVMGNFTDCITDIQRGAMSRFLEPIYNAISWIVGISDYILKTVSQIRTALFSMKEIIFNVFKDIMALFVNILTKFQNLIVKIKDLMMKLGGTMAAIVYIAEGLSMAGSSVWKGPIGGLIRMVCFHPDTPVTLADGSTKKMKNLVIGEKLANNIDVLATMEIKGNSKSPYYKVWSKKLNDWIFVTADHLIQHPETKRFIEVQHYEEAIPTQLYGEKHSCLVTSTNTIPIGEFIFWDWED
jgi:hypothetical protein|uniref:Hedgehog/Intein (Hint) domain-containing protein n=1 Tax=viral metagenome TaxID=1070528 RepID=A0A6C0IRB2_9ZZZZ